jgi:hypothetical protein
MVDDAQTKALPRDRVVLCDQVADYVIERALRVHPQGHREIARPQFQRSAMPHLQVIPDPVKLRYPIANLHPVVLRVVPLPGRIRNIDAQFPVPDEPSLLRIQL